MGRFSPGLHVLLGSVLVPCLPSPCPSSTSYGPRHFTSLHCTTHASLTFPRPSSASARSRSISQRYSFHTVPTVLYSLFFAPLRRTLPAHLPIHQPPLAHTGDPSRLFRSWVSVSSRLTRPVAAWVGNCKRGKNHRSPSYSFPFLDSGRADVRRRKSDKKNMAMA